MTLRQPICQPIRHLPRLWLVSDARNDRMLAAALAAMPRGSGLIYRHYHLAPTQRRARFARLARMARARGHAVVLAGGMAQARAWRADGAYGPPALLARGAGGLRLITAHGFREIRQARAARADAILLSPVFASHSHPGGKVLGPLRFRLLAAQAQAPVIALGGINAARARRLGADRWAAIDGLAPKNPQPIVDGDSPPGA